MVMRRSYTVILALVFTHRIIHKGTLTMIIVMIMMLTVLLTVSYTVLHFFSDPDLHCSS